MCIHTINIKINNQINMKTDLHQDQNIRFEVIYSTQTQFFFVIFVINNQILLYYCKYGKTTSLKHVFFKLKN